MSLTLLPIVSRQFCPVSRGDICLDKGLLMGDSYLSISTFQTAIDANNGMRKKFKYLLHFSLSLIHPTTHPQWLILSAYIPIFEKVNLNECLSLLTLPLDLMCLRNKDTSD